jgi:hypothetical protein
MSCPTIEDAIHQREDDERGRGGGISFLPLYAFVAQVAYVARAQERQGIIDAMNVQHEPGHSAEWKEGHNAALATLIRILVERSTI